MGHDSLTLTAGKSPYKNQRAMMQQIQKNRQKEADTQAMVQMFSSLITQGASLWVQAKQAGGAQQTAGAQQTQQQTPAQQAQGAPQTGPMSKSQAKATLASTTKAIQQQTAMIAQYETKLTSFKSIEQEKTDIDTKISQLEEQAYGKGDAKAEAKADGNNLQKLNHLESQIASAQADSTKYDQYSNQLKAFPADVPDDPNSVQVPPKPTMPDKADPEYQTKLQQYQKDDMAYQAQTKLKEQARDKQSVKTNMKAITDKYGGKDPKAAIQEFEKQKKDLEGASFDGKEGSKSCADVKKELADLKAKKTALEKQLEGKKVIEQAKELCEKNIESLKVQQTNAQTTLDTIQTAKDLKDASKSNLKEAKSFSYDADGSKTKRTKWERFWGANKGDATARQKALDPFKDQYDKQKTAYKNLKSGGE